MIDKKFLRENPDVVKENIKKKFQDEKLPLVDKVIELDAQLEALPEAEKKSAEYKIAKNHANGLNTMILQWAMIPSEIFTCPYVEYPRTEDDY